MRALAGLGDDSEFVLDRPYTQNVWCMRRKKLRGSQLTRRAVVGSEMAMSQASDEDGGSPFTAGGGNL